MLTKRITIIASTAGAQTKRAHDLAVTTHHVFALPAAASEHAGSEDYRMTGGPP